MLPLRNRRILITRPKDQASALADQLAAQGATPILLPTIELAPPTSYQALDQALRTLKTYDWLLFTSANAVQAFAARARTLGLPLRPNRIAAIGPATAKAVQGIGLTVDLIPSQYIAEAFAEALLPHAPASDMLLIRAAQARDHLPEALAAAGARLTLAEAYQTVIPKHSVDTLIDLLARDTLDAITFTSASTAQNLAALLHSASLTLPAEIVRASIGPITTQAMQALALPPTMEAAESTIPSLVEALANHYA